MARNWIYEKGRAGGGALVGAAGPAGSVQYNGGNSTMAGDANMIWDSAGKALSLSGSEILVGLASDPALSTTGKARIYYQTGGQLMVSYNGAAYVPLAGTGATSAVGPVGAVQYQKGAGAFGGDPGLVFDPAAGTPPAPLLTTTNITLTGRILVNGSYVLGTSAQPALPSGGYAKWYYDGTQLMVSYNGAAYVPMIPGQTPWLSNIDGATFSLSNANQISANAQVSAQSSATGDLVAIRLKDVLWNTYNNGAFREVWRITKADAAGVAAGTQNLSFYASDNSGGYLSTPLTLQRAATGYVGIYNCINPQYPLHVNGSANLTAIKCDNGYIQSDSDIKVQSSTDLTAIRLKDVLWNSQISGGGYKERWRISKDDATGDATGTENLHLYSSNDAGGIIHTALTLQRATGYVGVLDKLQPAFPLHVSGASATDTAFVMKDAASAPAGPGSGYGGLAHQSGSVYFYYTGSAWNTVDFSQVGGGGQMQTPWLQNINGAGFALSNASQVTVQTSLTSGDLVALRQKDVLWNTYISGGFKECWRITKEDAISGGVTAGTANLSFWASDNTGGFQSVPLTLQRATGFVGIGNNVAPGFPLHVLGKGVVAIVVEGNTGASAPIPGVIGICSPGSRGSETAVPNNGVLLSFGGRGALGPNLFTSAASANVTMLAKTSAGGNWFGSDSSGDQGAYIVFQTTKAGSPNSARANRMYVWDTGLVEIVGLAGAGVLLDTGYFQSNDSTGGGFYSPCTSVSTLNLPNGGASLGMACYLFNRSSAPTNPLSNYGGLAYKSGSVYWYYNSSSGWQTVDFAATGGSLPSNITANSYISTMGSGIATAFGLQSGLFGVDGSGDLVCQKITVAGYTVVSGNAVWLGGVQCSDHVYGLDFGIMSSTPGTGKATGAGSTTSANIGGIPTGPGSTQPAFTVACSDGYNRPVRGGLICSQ